MAPTLHQTSTTEDDEFTLDVQVIAEAPAGVTITRCDSSDGCGLVVRVGVHQRLLSR